MTHIIYIFYALCQSYVFREEKTICAVIDQSIRGTTNCPNLPFLIKKKKPKKQQKNIHDITQIFKESLPINEGVTSSQPASNLLFFFYFSFISPLAPRAWPWGKKDVRSRCSAGLQPNWPMAGRQSFPVPSDVALSFAKSTYCCLREEVKCVVTFPSSGLPFPTSLASTTFPGQEGRPRACAQTMSPISNCGLTFGTRGLSRCSSAVLGDMEFVFTGR